MAFSEISTIVILTGLAGACIPAGAVLGSIERIRPRWLEKEFRHFVIAFGGGILLGAVSVVLVPQGISSMSNSLLAIPAMLAGGFTFFGIERFLGLHRRESPQLIGLTLDYVPEAVALGCLIAVKSEAAPLMALLIALQNFPEGFNSYRELKSLGINNTKTFLIMSALVPLGPIAGLVGYFYLSEHEVAIGVVMLFSAGGILYLIFQDIAPQSRLKKHWGPPLGAVFGFCLALMGEMLLMHI